MTSTSLQNFIDDYLIDPETNTYQIDNFIIVNNGVMLDGTEEGEELRGAGLNDILWGNGGADRLFGGGGTDLLTGGAGDDLMSGGNGNDRLQGWDEDDVLKGGGGRDALYGGQGNDMLYGGGGDDYLCAGSNSDELYGGKGADVFVFRPDVGAPKSQSVYKDFEIGVDTLRIDSELMPNGFRKGMIKVDDDGDLYIQTAGGHRMVFETLDRDDINALYATVELI